MHRIRSTRREGFEALELTSPAGLRAAFVPAAGMVCASLRLDAAELLGQRQGLRRYAREGATLGIPLLYPWANRLARYGYSFGETRVEIPRDPSWVPDDGAGLPIHGIVPARLPWRLLERGADAGRAWLRAGLASPRSPELLALFPFPHELSIEVSLRQECLEITTRLRASGDRPVPVAFGYHPWFRLPDVPRPDWEIEVPIRRRAVLDARLLPTGASEAFRVEPGPLGERVLDDLFPELEPEPVFSLSGGGRRIEVAFGPEYPVAVVHAPADDDVICFEPMTAPTNPFEGGGPLRLLAPGHELAARFAIRVLRTASAR